MDVIRAGITDGMADEKWARSSLSLQSDGAARAIISAGRGGEI